jgi:nitrogen fixation NifU-like protein
MKKISSLYSKKVIDHFQNPRNMGEIDNPSGRGRVGNPTCGDLMELQIKVEKQNNQEIITDAKFQTFGCGAAIATSSVLTELIIGKSIEEAKKITNKKVVETLDDLPLAKRHCSVLAEEALKKAIVDYQENTTKNKK